MHLSGSANYCDFKVSLVTSLTVISNISTAQKYPGFLMVKKSQSYCLCFCELTIL